MRSSGWSLWVQCGGNVIMCMPYSFAYTVASSDLWLWWPSSNNTCWLVWLEPLMFTKCWRNLMNAAASSSLGTASETEFSGGWMYQSQNLEEFVLTAGQVLLSYTVFSEIRSVQFFSSAKTWEWLFQWVPTTFYGICVNSGVSDDLYAVIDSIMNVALCLQWGVCFPAVWMNGCSRLYPVLNYWNQFVHWSIVNGDKKHLTGQLSHSTPPNTHILSTRLPLLYFILPKLLSSISTILRGPPICSDSFWSTTKQTSLQKL